MGEKLTSVEAHRLAKVLNYGKIVGRTTRHYVKCPTCGGSIMEDAYENHKRVCKDLQSLRDYNG